MNYYSQQIEQLRSRLSQNIDTVSLLTIFRKLHAHLSGSITRQCLHEIWLRKKAQNPNFAIEDPWVLMPPGKVNYGLDM